MSFRNTQRVSSGQTRSKCWLPPVNWNFDLGNPGREGRAWPVEQLPHSTDHPQRSQFRGVSWYVFGLRLIYFLCLKFYCNVIDKNYSLVCRCHQVWWSVNQKRLPEAGQRFKSVWRAVPVRTWSSSACTAHPVGRPGPFQRGPTSSETPVPPSCNRKQMIFFVTMFSKWFLGGLIWL